MTKMMRRLMTMMATTETVAVTAAADAAAVVTDAMQLIGGWDLSGPTARVRREHPGWSDETLRRAVTGYRQFFYLRKMYPPGTVRLVPHIGMDEVWHAHILHTKDYADICEAVLGYFFHHNPTEGGTPSEQDRNDYRHMRSLIRHHFGDDKDPEVWLAATLTK